MKFVVTAGPTREYLDPVRFLSNPSTGKMGFAVARAAAPVTLKTPKGVRRIDVTSAREMLAAVEKELFSNSRDMVRYSSGRVGDAPLPVGAALRADRISQCSMVFIATAAVADWRPAKCAARKLKKGQMSDTLKLVRNPDILKTVARRAKHQVPARASTIFVGFAAETNDVIAEARRPREEPRHDRRERRDGEGRWLWRRHQSRDFCEERRLG